MQLTGKAGDPPRLETVGVIQLRQAERLAARARSPLREEALQMLLRFCVAASIERARPDPTQAWLDSVVPDGVTGACLAGPLAGREGPIGVAVLVAGPGKPLMPGDEVLLQRLLGPLAFSLSRDRLVHSVHRLEEALEADRRALSQPLDVAESIIGAETGLREVMERVQLVSGTDTPVLVLGETGSGKEVIARALHAGSARAMGPS